MRQSVRGRGKQQSRTGLAGWLAFHAPPPQTAGCQLFTGAFLLFAQSNGHHYHLFKFSVSPLWLRQQLFSRHLSCLGGFRCTFSKNGSWPGLPPDPALWAHSNRLFFSNSSLLTYCSFDRYWYSLHSFLQFLQLHVIQRPPCFLLD